MLCMGDCEGRKIGSRQVGFLERVFQRYFSANRLNASAENTAELLRTPRTEKVILRESELHVAQMAEHCIISCGKGSAWVTCSGRVSDYILKAGESLSLRGEGKIIISRGGEDSMVRICVK